MLTIVTKWWVKNSNPMNNTGISGVSKNGSELTHQNRGPYCPTVIISTELHESLCESEL